MNTKEIGERSEAQVLAILLKAGKVILMPFGDNQRYDIAIDNKGKLERVQCKTGHIKKGKIIFQTCSSSTHRGGLKKGYRGQIEFFGVYCTDNNKVYMVPVNDIPEKQAVLRINPTSSFNGIKTRWAKDYEFTGHILSE